jgi:hypothetical protein
VLFRTEPVQPAACARFISELVVTLFAAISLENDSHLDVASPGDTEPSWKFPTDQSRQTRRKF